MKNSVHIFFSAILNESRLLKICKGTLAQGLVDEIMILGVWDNGLPQEELILSNTRVIRIKTLIKSKKPSATLLRILLRALSIFQFQFLIARQCIKIKPKYLSCHNLQLLPICVIIKFLTRSKLIYEPHELETEKTGLTKFSKFFLKLIERIFIRFCDNIVTVCEPITDFYVDKYNLAPNKTWTIRNVPLNPSIGKKYKRSNIFREEFQLPEDCIVYIYQGLIDRFRGILNYLETFSKLDDKHHLVLMGYGDDEELVKSYADKYSNIHFKPSVPVEEIIKYTSSADVGLFIIPGELSLSYKYALPNKFYEYAIAGLYICVSDNFQYLRKIVTMNNLGSVIGSDESSLLDWINDHAFIREDLIPNEESYAIRKTLGWQEEEKIYKEIYK